MKPYPTQTLDQEQLDVSYADTNTSRGSQNVPFVELADEDSALWGDKEVQTRDPKSRTVLDSIKEKRKHIGPILCILVANILYYICDERCPFDDVNKCAVQFLLKKAPQWVVQTFICACLFMNVLLKGISRRISRFYALAVVINVIYLCFYFNPVLDKYNYGELFAILLGMFLSLITVAILIGKSLGGCYRRSRSGTLMGIPLFLLGCFTLFYFTKVQNSCQFWKDGLGGEKLNNDLAPTGQIAEPSVCIYEVTDGWLDFSRFMTCSAYEADQNILNKYYPKGSLIGLPRTEKFTEEERFDMRPNVLSKSVALSSATDPAAQDYEVFLDKTSEVHPVIQIDVKRNEALVQERSKIEHKGLGKNLLVIYIDSLSRVNSLRKLKKTMGWFETYMNQKDPSAEAFQFFKYHSVTPYTPPNLYEAMYGIEPSDTEFTSANPKMSFLQQFKDNGYITGHASDFCQISPLDYFPGQIIKDVPYDHEGISFSCDPHYHDPESPYSIFHGPYSSRRRCLYGKDTFEYVFDYGDQFWRAYPTEKKILYLDFLDAHEGTGEHIKYMDDAIFNFLQGLKTDNLLEDTSIVFYSDHGLHMQGLFHLMGFSVVTIERSLPTLYMVLPTDISEKHRDDLKENSQKLFTARALYYFFRSFANKEDTSSLSQSLLSNVSPNKTCDDLFILPEVCVCSYKS